MHSRQRFGYDSFVTFATHANFVDDVTDTDCEQKITI